MAFATPTPKIMKPILGDDSSGALTWGGYCQDPLGSGLAGLAMEPMP